MATIVLATFGSLGDLHPKIALGLELKGRGHKVTIAAMEYYREKIGKIGLGFAPMAPHLDPNDRERAAEMMDAKKGTEAILRDIIMPSLHQMYIDLTAAVDGADMLISGEIVYAVRSVVEKTGIQWVSTSLAPGAIMSDYDPFVPPLAPWYDKLHGWPAWFHNSFFALMRWTIRDWYEPYKKFRRELGLSEDHDPIFSGRFSELLHLMLFSKVIGAPQPDWTKSFVQPGFCFYDGQNDDGKMPPELSTFLDAGEPPIVFTLGSAAVLDPRNFFEQSAAAAKKLGRRAVLLYGSYSEPPKGLTAEIVGFEYAPYSLVFPRAACIVHQGGVGTTAQVLRAGVPQLFMPYGHDQPDNAARCRRLGVAEIISRDDYGPEKAAELLTKLLSIKTYAERAAEVGAVVRSEGGVQVAANEIEAVL